MKKERVLYYDIINIFAIVSVIALHCNGIVHLNPSIRAWNTSLIVECLFYAAVPLFFMLSGATLMNYRDKYDTKTFFKKRIIKCLIPFISWICIMLLWKIFVIKKISINSINSIGNLLNVVFSNQEESTYYFMFQLFGLYLIMPLLSLLTKKEYRKTLYLIVFLYFIFNGLIPNILQLFNIYYNTSFSVPIGYYVAYAVLGYLVSTEKFIALKYKIILGIGAIIGILYRYIITYILSKSSGIVIEKVWGYSSWHCILLTLFIFIIIKDSNKIIALAKNKRISSIITKISSCSFGIYLIHQIVMYYERILFNINVYSWQWRTLGILSTYFISLLIVYGFKKIPILNKIVP